jgi:hypothetical protein
MREDCVEVGSPLGEGGCCCSFVCEGGWFGSSLTLFSAGVGATSAPDSAQAIAESVVDVAPIEMFAVGASTSCDCGGCRWLMSAFWSLDGVASGAAELSTAARVVVEGYTAKS